jgi:GntR family transcriptional regulator/MocR family aminotransferase
MLLKSLGMKGPVWGRTMEPAVFTSLVRLDPQAKGTLVGQLYRNLSTAVREGHLPAGTRLPSTRAAAAHWGVARNTVIAAYELLASEGVISLRQGAAAEVVPLPRPRESKAEPLPALSQRGQSLSRDPRIETGRTGLMSPGEPDPALFPADDWALCLRRATRLRQSDSEGYENYHGLPALRRALADQITRHRGCSCDADQILVTPGTQASLTLLAQVLADPGETALIEDPGYGGARLAFASAGLKLAPLPVDSDGADSTLVAPDLAPRLIYVTPSTQYPTGVRMTLLRRMALLDMAARHGAWVLEDDYDSEFVWQGREIAAVAALPRAERVIYLGSAAKTLLPSLRIGWIVAPVSLVAPLRAAQRTFGMAANVHAQAALADFIDTGRYRAHLHRISKTYAARRDVLFQTLGAWHGDRLRLSNPHGGLQMVAELAPSAVECRLRDLIRHEGFAVAGLSDYRLTPGNPGLVMGFAQTTPRHARRFAKALAAALRAES